MIAHVRRIPFRPIGSTWIKASAEQLPLEDQRFDGAMAILTTHHWSDVAQGFREVARELRPRAPFVLFTSASEKMRRYWLCHYSPIMMERSSSEMQDMRNRRPWVRSRYQHDLEVHLFLAARRN